MNRILSMVLNNFWAAPPAWFKLCHYAKNADKYSKLEMWQHIQYILRRAIKGGNIDLIVTGLENLPKENGFMLYGNHQGMFDVMAIAATCDIPLGAVLKKEIFNIPFIHQVALCTGSYPMDREDVRQSLTVIQAVTEEVKKGGNYMIFPEGTRSKKGNEMLEFHGGSFRCATKSKCTIVPIALVDSFKVLDEKGSRPVSMQLHYLTPIPYEEYSHMKPAEVAELVRGRIADKIRECTQGG